jgi:hypothetical protein
VLAAVDSGDDHIMTYDPFADQDLTYTLIVKAGSESAALRAFDTNGRIATGKFSVASAPGHRAQMLTMDFDYGDGSEWGHDIGAFRVAVEERLDEWMGQGWSAINQGSGFPEGGLLYWRRGSIDER